jgi:glycosyltransferase involved in cell wall biosynthesis
MTIGIEAQRIFRKKKHGMDIVALQLIRALQQIDTQNQYKIFVKEDEDDKVISETDNFKIIRLPSAPYPYWEQVLLKDAVKDHRIELLHCTSNTGPLNVKTRMITTVHDIIYLEKLNFTKGTWYQILGNLYRRWNVPGVVRKSSKIITVSDYERDRIISHFKLTDEMVQTVYNGVGDHFRRKPDDATLQRIKSKYALPDRYVFFLGNTDPKKNVIGVMRALSVLRKRNQLSFTLLMLDIDRDYLRKIADEIGDREVLEHISFSGYVPNDELPAIYTMAELFLYPSLRESFGIPILEAMACGVPVITSTTSSMPEVSAGAALLIDPTQPEAIADAILHAINNKEVRESLVMKGFERSQHFTWKNNALKTLSLYQSVLNEN